MRNSEMKWLCLLVILVISVLDEKKLVLAEECEVEIRGMTIECLYYMNKGDQRLLAPNDRCKKAITDAFPKLQCWCNSLSRKVAFPPGASMGDILSWKRILHCFSYTRLPLPAGYKCWNFIVPPGLPPSKVQE
ncbi:uncharacterized protein LOC108333813 [Vigna angularis]|uniref:uncharacterized protein LOC108333813 n=1 Tax=Phaseolus angularis TaxID=3914 RepID=UPI00080A79EA|nr:uncharacterized protein LOC108333813 [Vigna angularis]